MQGKLFLVLFVFVVAGCVSRVHQGDENAGDGDVRSGMDCQPADERGYIVSVGDMAPDFTSVVASTGDTIRLSDYVNKRVVMLQFTASWCGVCRREMPQIEERIWQRHKDDPRFALIGIDRDEPADAVVGFAAKTGVTYPLVLDDGADIFGLYADKGAGVTRNVIIGMDGRIVMMTRLYDEREFERMVCLIDSLLSDCNLSVTK